MAIVGHPRIAKRADEHGIERPQRVIAAWRNRLAGGEEMIRPPRQRMKVDAANSVEDPDGLGGHFSADTVAGNDRDTQSH